jgi:uncharacterized repeat protein (TIGR03803 family)
MSPLRNHRITFSLSLLILCISVAVAAPAQTFTLLSSLSEEYGSTSVPLLQGIDGNLYGAGVSGGPLKDGTIFRLTPEGSLSLFHYFHIGDGENPNALVLETNGNLYGTTGTGGGTSPCGPSGGCGTVFGFTSQGTLFTLYDFNTTGPGGTNLTLGPDGSTFYGTGLGQSASSEFGTIFKITPKGVVTSLLNLDVSNYGPGPLVLGTNGNFYGTTVFGGPSFLGTVFEVTPEGTFTSLHTFTGSDGQDPTGTLVEGTDGNFYGTTAYGGTSNNGTVFVISPGGRAFRTLYNFTGGSDGSHPGSGLVLGSDGNFYGTTGGFVQAAPYGTVFEITPAGVLTTLHTFDGADGGHWPTLTQHTNGTFYGTTADYGANNNCLTGGCGTLFSLSNGLTPFVTAVPALRGIGAKVLLLGQGFAGATGVTFNGVAATFTVNSDTEITTTVPVGATKGFIQVVTPGGTLSTKVFFTVG